MFSATGSTIYFNDHAFRKFQGISSNYYDVESKEDYWISGVKKNGCDRHWAGRGKVMIDRKIIPAYLTETGMKQLDPGKYEIVEIEDVFPVERINRLENTGR